MEKLKSYMAREGITQAEMAKILDCNQSTIHRLLAGTRDPSFSMAALIENVTGDEVRIGDWKCFRAMRVIEGGS